MSVFFGEHEPTPTTELPDFDPATFWQAEQHEADHQVPAIDFSSLVEAAQADCLDAQDRRSLLCIPRYYDFLKSYFDTTAIITDRFGLDHQARRDHLQNLYPAAEEASIEGVSFRYWRDNLSHSQLRHNVLTRLSFGVELIGHSLEPLLKVRPDAEPMLAEIQQIRHNLVSEAQLTIHRHYQTQAEQIEDIKHLNEQAVLLANKLAELVASLNRT